MKTYSATADFILPMAVDDDCCYIKGEARSREGERSFAIIKIPTREYMELVEDYIMSKRSYFEILGGVGGFYFKDFKKTRKAFYFDGEYIARDPESDGSEISTYPIYEWVAGKSRSICEMERG